MSSALDQILHTWTTGGWVMPALAVVAFVTYLSAATLLVSLHHRGLTMVTDAILKTWVERPQQAPKHLRGLIEYTQSEVRTLREIEGRFREVEAAKVPGFDRRLAFLNIMVVSAPCLDCSARCWECC